MAAILVQKASNFGPGAASIVVGAGQGWATPTSGNLILAWANADATVALTGYTAGISVVDGNGVYFFYKVSAGTESTLTFTVGGSTSPTTVGALEFSGLTATPFDVQLSSSSVGTPGSSTGSVSVTGTNALGDQYIALAGVHALSAVPTSPVWTNSFVNQQTVVTALLATQDCASFVATFQNTGTGTVSTAASWSTGTASDRQELLIGFKLAAAGGGSPALAFAPKRRRGGLPPRRTVRQGRISTPVRAQLNPPILPTDARERRRFLVPVRRSEIASPVTAQVAAPVNPAVSQLVPGRILRRWLSRNRAQGAADGPLTAQDALPVTATCRRLVVPSRRPRVAAPEPASARHVSPPARRTLRVPRVMRWGQVVAPVQTQVTAINPTITATVFGRLRLIGRIQPRARIETPAPAQQTVVTNPTITATVFGRLRLIGRIQPRARIETPAPAQQSVVTNPTITATVFGRLRLIGRIQPRAKVINPVQAQTGAPSGFGRLRLTARIQPRARIRTPAPAQQAVATNPTITATVFGRLRLIGRIQPRAKVNDPVPAQQAVATNPTITATVFGRLRLIGRRQPRARITGHVPGHAVIPVPTFGRLRPTGRIQSRARIRTPAPVQTAVTNPTITATVFGRLRSIGRIQPRARINEPVPAQQQAVPNPKITSTVFGRLRLSGRTNRIPRIVKPIPAQINPLYPVKPSRVIAVRGFSRRRGAPISAPQVQPTAETRTTPATGLRGLRRVWLKVRRKNVTPVPGQVTTLEGPLVITDSSGGVSGRRGGTAGIGGVYDSDDAVSGRRGGTAGIGPEKSDDAVTGKYDSDSDTL